MSGTPAGPRERRAAPAHRGPHRVARAHLRPHLRGCSTSAATSARTRPRRPVASWRRIWSESDLSSRSACAPASGTGWTRRNSRPPRRRSSTSRAATRQWSRRCPPRRRREALAATVRIWADLAEDEADLGLPRSREPQLGFVWARYRWARQERLDRVLIAASERGTELRPVTSSGGASSCWTCSTRSPPRPARLRMARRSRAWPGRPWPRSGAASWRRACSPDRERRAGRVVLRRSRRLAVA